jgi:hypothetical protein
VLPLPSGNTNQVPLISMQPLGSDCLNGPSLRWYRGLMCVEGIDGGGPGGGARGLAAGVAIDRPTHAAHRQRQAGSH